MFHPLKRLLKKCRLNVKIEKWKVLSNKIIAQLHELLFAIDTEHSNQSIDNNFSLKIEKTNCSVRKEILIIIGEVKK